ncbi:winged helix-turn-helix domain-containing protein [Paenibacillus thermotolerans]|uniref:winged helix-turn-helix domain-containing protein n=1 Tax=Paenibacillus thermotolerans TaxID=3027807 RepID=UPI0023683EF0|nr:MULTISPECIES: winged helix-turn-helix domain-containing protein [unclassified Paenibacillus]
MGYVAFDRSARTASYKGRSIELLPKEFMLLEHLYRHIGQTLSREQLLDAVWPLETPTDRTVDDHVYRLRKKLSDWDGAFELETVRGVGYRLADKARDAKPNPLALLPDYAEHMNTLVQTYIRYGRGDALQALSNQRDVFGLESDAFFRLYALFMGGDTRALLQLDVPFGQKALYLLHFYHRFKPDKSRRFVEEALRRRIMPEHWHRELEQWNMIFMCMDWGEFGRAKEKLDAAMKQALEEPGMEGIVPYLLIRELEYWMRTGVWEMAERTMERIEARLSEYPYQREQGGYYIFKGIARYRSSPKEGIERIEQGLSVLRDSRFIPHLLDGLYAIFRFSESEPWKPLKERYAPEWERKLAETGLLELLPEIEYQLQINLG